jgi:Ubiquitin-activating enzyme E1 FCCH domain
MGEKLFVGPISKGLKSNLKPFAIDNDSFPVLENAYQWRGRVKRKRGTRFLTRLRIPVPETSIGNSGASPWTINTIFSTLVPAIVPPANSTIVPGSVVITIDSTPDVIFTDNGDGTLSGTKTGVITNADNANPVEITSNGHTLSTGDTVTIEDVLGETELNGNTYTITVTGVNTFTLDGVDGTLFGVYAGGGNWTSPSAANTGTINYQTGVIVLTHTAGAGNPTVAYFSYYPSLPVMGFRDFAVNSSQYPGNLAFDTEKAYNVLVAFPFTAYNVSYYKNPAVDATNLPGYTPKTAWDAFSWNGENYQQFYTINYQNALWATNGITVPFTTTNIGMQFKPITGVANIVAGNGTTVVATADLTIVNHGLVVGDFVYVNEVGGVTGINFQTGYVTVVVGVNVVTVTFPFAILGGIYTLGGIAQYLTSNSDDTKDCIRWYDGDPTNGAISPPGFLQGSGWVNFMPPLSREAFSIADLPARQYYLVGAKLIANFKDRLIFFGPVVQASSGSPIYLQDTAIFSQNGTPYYTSSFAYTAAAPTDPTLTQFGYKSVLLPENQTATAPAWFEDQTGFGGFLSVLMSLYLP